jgi:hypothetical protein
MTDNVPTPRPTFDSDDPVSARIALPGIRLRGSSSALNIASLRPQPEAAGQAEAGPSVIARIGDAETDTERRLAA